MKNKTINVKGLAVTVSRKEHADYISLKPQDGEQYETIFRKEASVAWELETFESGKKHALETVSMCHAANSG